MRVFRFSCSRSSVFDSLVPFSTHLSTYLTAQLTQRGPESKLVSRPIVVANWPSLPLKIVTLAISSRNLFGMHVIVEVHYTPRFRLLWHLLTSRLRRSVNKSHP